MIKPRSKDNGIIEKLALIEPKGFTLIELMVVIATIGLLSSIVLVSVNSARNKANDAATKAVVEQTRKIAELIYNNNDNNSYADLCSSGVLNTLAANYGASLAKIHADIVSNSSGPESCYSNATSYCLNMVFKGGNTYCVEASGKVMTGQAGSTFTGCNQSFAVCAFGIID